MKKKIVALCLVVAMAAVAVIGSTIAYLTSQDSEKNTFTVGNVKIDLIESQYHRVNAGKGETTEAEPISGGYLWASNVKLEGNQDNTPNFVTSHEQWDHDYFSDAQIKADAATYKNGYFAEHAKLMVPGNNVRKNPYVINTGKNDAYIRVRVLVPVSLFTVLDNGPTWWTSTALNEGEVTSEAVKKYTANGNKPTEDMIVTGEDDNKYYQFDFTYTDAVKPEEMTFWNVWGNVAIDPNATAADLKDVTSFDVIFQADAIQASGFANAADAFKAFDAQKKAGK